MTEEGRKALEAIKQLVEDSRPGDMIIDIPTDIFPRADGNFYEKTYHDWIQNLWTNGHVDRQYPIYEYRLGPINLTMPPQTKADWYES